MELCTQVYILLFIYRIEQPNISSTERLFRALQTCPLIERVCVISISRSKLSSESLEEFVFGAPKLVFLYVFMDTLTETVCRRIKNTIFRRYVCKQELHIKCVLEQLCSFGLCGPDGHYYILFIYCYCHKNHLCIIYLALQYISNLIHYIAPHLQVEQSPSESNSHSDGLEILCLL